MASFFLQHIPERSERSEEPEYSEYAEYPRASVRDEREAEVNQRDDHQRPVHHVPAALEVRSVTVPQTLRNHLHRINTHH